MKYRALKQLKTTTKLLKLCDTLEEAIEIINKQGGRFDHLSYIGGFPFFRDDNNKLYSIQGQIEGMEIVCSINKKELERAGFCG